MAFIEHARRNLLVMHGRLHEPGATVFTLIPCLASSPAAVFVIMITAALAGEFTIDPECRIMIFDASRIQ